MSYFTYFLDHLGVILQSWAAILLAMVVLALHVRYLNWRQARRYAQPAGPVAELEDGEDPQPVAAVVKPAEYKARTHVLWTVREELGHLSAWAGQPLPQNLTDEERVGVEEAEVVHRWLFRHTDAELLREEITRLARRLPR